MYRAHLAPVELFCAPPLYATAAVSLSAVLVLMLGTIGDLTGPVAPGPISSQNLSYRHAGMTPHLCLLHLAVQFPKQARLPLRQSFFLKGRCHLRTCLLQHRYTCFLVAFLIHCELHLSFFLRNISAHQFIPLASPPRTNALPLSHRTPPSLLYSTSRKGEFGAA